jgi:uncharacterized protein YggE
VKIVGLLVVCSIVIVALLQSRLTQPISTIQIVGQGRVPVKFDTASFDIQVSAMNEKTPETATTAIKEKVVTLETALDAIGIAKEDRQLTGLAVIPQMNSDITNPMKQVIGSYTAVQQVSVVVKNIGENAERVQEITTAVAKAGATQIGSIRFSASSIDTLRQQARLTAAQSAQTNATSVASATNIKLVKVTGWYENVIYSPDQTIGYSYGMPQTQNYINNVQLPDGRRDLVVEVTLSYEVK